MDLGNAPQNNKPNEWDVAQAAWIPDWFGDNGRTTVQPFFQTDCALNTINYGCFSNKTLDADHRQGPQGAERDRRGAAVARG